MSRRSLASSRRWWLLLALAAGCRFDPHFESGVLKCGAGGSCPQGFSCQIDRCVVRGDASSLPPPDSALSLDGRQPPQPDLAPSGDIPAPPSDQMDGGRDGGLGALSDANMITPPTDALVAATPDADDLERGLVGHWALDEKQGDVAHDSSKNHNDGVLHGFAVDKDWMAGRGGGGALNFNGSVSWIEVKPSASVDSIGAELTITAWAMREWTPPGDGYHCLVSRRIKDTSAEHYYFGFIGDEMAFLSANVKRHLTTTLNRPPGGQWSHFAATYDGQQVRLYVDGELTYTKEQTGAVAVADLSSLVIGGNQDTTAFTSENLWRGRIDDVRVYNRGLSPTEIQALFSLP